MEETESSTAATQPLEKSNPVESELGEIVRECNQTLKRLEYEKIPKLRGSARKAMEKLLGILGNTLRTTAHYESNKYLGDRQTVTYRERREALLAGWRIVSPCYIELEKIIDVLLRDQVTDFDESSISKQ